MPVTGPRGAPAGKLNGLPGVVAVAEPSELGTQEPRLAGAPQEILRKQVHDLEPSAVLADAEGVAQGAGAADVEAALLMVPIEQYERARHKKAPECGRCG